MNLTPASEAPPYTKGELRCIENRSDREALLLVTCAHPQEEVESS